MIVDVMYQSGGDGLAAWLTGHVALTVLTPVVAAFVPPTKNTIRRGFEIAQGTSLFFFPAIVLNNVASRLQRSNGCAWSPWRLSTAMHMAQRFIGSALGTFTRLILHVGFNDTSCCQSEVTKEYFRELFTFRSSTGLTVCISGPLPSLARGAWRFSRLLNLNTWLQSTSTSSGFGFIDNFNLFWNRSSFYWTDGIHPSGLGSRVLTDNILHAVQSTTPKRNWLPLPSTLTIPPQSTASCNSSTYCPPLASVTVDHSLHTHHITPLR